MAQPNKNQKQEKFKRRDKLAIIISNEKYGKTIMADLSAVKDDHLNIRQTVEMMNIPDVNVFEIRDATWRQMEDLDVEINQLIMLRSKELKNETGICGVKFKQGILWNRAKVKAMMEGASDDYIIVSIVSL